MTATAAQLANRCGRQDQFLSLLREATFHNVYSSILGETPQSAERRISVANRLAHEFGVNASGG